MILPDLIALSRIPYVSQYCHLLLCHDLEAFSVDDCWARLVVFLFRDPHRLECREGSENGSSDPYRVFPLWWGDDLDLHGGRGKGRDLLLHTVCNTGEHGGATRQDRVGVQVLSDVDVTLHDGVVGGLVDSAGLHAQEGWLEQRFRASESLVANGDDLSIGQLIRFLEG